MNILHVLSQFEVTGAETYAAALADFQVHAGHTVIIVSDTFHSPTRAEFYSLPIGIRTLPQRMKNISAIRKLLRDKKIDIVHAHSRAASWISFWATRGVTVPLVSTIHGRQHIHLSSKTFHMYGEKVIAVCEAIRAHMISDLNYSSDSITVVRNGIDLRRWPLRPDMVGEKKVVALVGRLSGPKGEIARRIITDVFPNVIRRFPTIECWIVGGMKESEGIPRLIRTVNAAIGSENILFRGFIKDIDEVYRNAALIIGSGRVAMEALACGTRVIAVGESSSPGLYSGEIEQQVLETNFGDAGKPEPIDYSKIENDIVTVLSQDTRSTAEQGRAVIEREYALDRIAQRVSRVYAEAIAAKMDIHEIPVLMYHRVTDTKPAGTKHGIYVTTAEFVRQLAFLDRKGYEALTFADLSEILRGNRKLQARPIILTFDDGYEDNFVNAFPILKRHSMKAVVFILGDRSITTNSWDMTEGEPEAKLLNDEQIQVMAEYGIEFGSHSMDHRRLTELSIEEAQNEITASKLLLEKRLGRGVISLAYPYGAVNERVKECVSRAGYEYGIAVDSGPRKFFDDLYEIRRIPVFPGAGIFSFWKKTSGKYHRYKKIKN